MQLSDEMLVLNADSGDHQGVHVDPEGSVTESIQMEPNYETGETNL